MTRESRREAGLSSQITFDWMWRLNRICADDQFIAVLAVHAHQKPRSSQAALETLDLSAQPVLGNSGRCCELCERNDSSVPLVQRREQLPFRRRQLALPPVLEDKREVTPIYIRIYVHQISGGDLCAAASAEPPPGRTRH